MPGDALNRIHWKSSAKKDRFMVKEFDQDPQGDVWLILDAYTNSHYEAKEKDMNFIPDSFWAWKNQEKFKLPPSTFEYAVSITASLANYFIKEDKSVGLACADSQMIVLPSERGIRQIGKVMDTLAFLEGQGSLSIDGLLESISHQIPRGSTVYLITTGNNNFTQLGLEILIRKRLNPFLIIVDKESFMNANQVGQEISDYSTGAIPQVTIQFNDVISEKLRKFIAL
jgi:uncharacterized protein (DUF58 family)